MAKATAGFVGFVDGRQVAVQEGAELSDDEPIVRANADVFGEAKRSTPKRTTAKRTTMKT